ncbi:hypothetical protein [Amycolatopsis jejuensis]|uniref:hypothetical protein n=1 Tax=Amycolatopsis jejuensis TaxID=330084 RepID=UPI000A4D5940|nr:hypothetical protein [Amycolatopsis jejuensis]
MAHGEPGGTGDLESVAKLVSLSETAPMPRIDGSEPPPLVAPRPVDPATAFAGALDGSTAVDQLAARGPAPDEPDASLDELLTAPPLTAPPSTTPPDRRRYAMFAGAAVLVCAGLGGWALWPSSSSGTTGQPAEPPPGPVRTSTSAPPAVSTLSATPTPPAATGEVRDTTVRATSRPATGAQQRGEQDEETRGNRPRDPMEDAFSSAVSSYMDQWNGHGNQPPRRWHG